MAIAGALELRASRVYAVDTVEDRLELARRYGAIPLRLDVHDKENSVVAKVLLGTGGRGCDAVLDCVGSGVLFH
jgi:threonine dehydrogenase-like Zn-dependent dehydrogenase